MLLPSGLSAFASRDAADKVMFGWVRGLTRVFPGVSIESALETFAKEFSFGPEFNVPSQKARYMKMQRDYLDAMKTKA
jgi:hypothetical protein